MRPPDLASTAPYIAWHARDAPETTAIVENGTIVTYRAMAADLIRCVQALRGLGVTHDTLVGVETPERYLQLLLMLACEAIGAASTALLPAHLRADDRVSPYCDIILTSGASRAPDRPRMIAIPSGWLAGLAGDVAAEGSMAVLDHVTAPDRVARIVRTSGTTGRPKAMPMTRATQQLRVVRSLGRVAQYILPDPRFLCLYNLTVGSVYVRVLGVLQHGGTVSFALSEDADRILADTTVNYAIFSLGDIERIVQRVRLPSASHGLHIEVIGDSVSPRLREQIKANLNASVTNKYSTNETNPIALIDGDNVGIPRVGTICEGVEVRIVDDAGRDLPLKEAGTIRVRSETMVRGYFNDATMTEAAFIDGWYQTSDIGYMPEPGKLVVLGRADDMLNIGGVKVAPSPIEALIRQIDGVKDVLVISVASPNLVGVLLAAIETDGDLPPPDPRRIVTILSKHTSDFAIMNLPRFPRTETGKIKRHEIEAAFRRFPSGDPIAFD